MIEPTPQEVLRFQKLWQQKYGEHLSEEEAKRKARTLIRQFQTVYSILSKHEQ